MAEDGQDYAAVTADDVAQRAGVSRWTVARAFKKDASISAKTRKTVLAAAEELGYVPDLLAASLASDRSNLVALMLDDFENPHKLVMLERLSRILRQAGCGTLLFNMLDSSDAPQAFLSAVQRRVDAAVVIGTRFDDGILDTALGARRVKKLIVFARSSQTPNTISITCDDDLAMTEIAAHLHGTGRRRPLFLAGPDSQSATLNRKASFLRHWQGLTGHRPAVLHADHYAAPDAFRIITDAWASMVPEARFDAVVCENDILAIGTMDALRYHLRLNVPQDIAVTGFDDIPLTAAPAYEITTYRQPITRMVQALVEILNGTASGDVTLPGQFIRRSSG